MDKILVAEDSFALANLLEFVLSNAGFDVTLCRTGSSAWQTAQEQKFDILLLDQQMPGMTGVEVLTAIRNDSPNRETNAFLCTAKTHELDLQNLHETLAIKGVFHKPFSPKDLVENLKQQTQVSTTN
ncbi:MAG: response regulator [Planctomycetota bacterium]